MASTVEQATTMIAQRYARELLERLQNIANTLDRLLALQQSPRKNFLAAGTIAGSATVGTTPSTITVTPLGLPPGTILGPDPHRRGLSVQNTSASGGPSLTVGLGTLNPVAGQGIVLPAGASWDGRLSGMLWTGAVSVIASAAGCNFSWVEARGQNASGLNEAI